LGPKTCKILTDFTQLPTLIANISGTRQDIKNRKDVISSDSSRVQRNKSGELWSTIHTAVHVSLDPPKSTFSGDYISSPRGRWPLKFLHALDTGQGLLAHTAVGVGGPLKILRANISKLGLKFHIFAPITLAVVGVTSRNVTSGCGS